MPEEIYGKIICEYDISFGLINILSENFEKDFYLIIYIGDEKIDYSKTYEFNKDDNKTVIFEIHSEKIAIQNMFEGLEYLTKVQFVSDSGAKIINMDNAFKGCIYLKEIIMEGWDTSELISMNSAFAFCSNLEEFPFDNMDLSKVKDMSHMLENSNVHTFKPQKFELSSVETLESMFENCYGLITVKFPKTESPNLLDISSMFKGCDSATTIDISSLQTSKVTNMS